MVRLRSWRRSSPQSLDKCVWRSPIAQLVAMPEGCDPRVRLTQALGGRKIRSVSLDSGGGGSSLARQAPARSYFNLWAARFDPERGIVVGQPFALSDFKSPRFMISPHVDRTAMSVSARQTILTMESVSGNIWMLDNVDR
jgi:hypothetical protein